MMGRTHMAIGFLAGLLALPFVDLNPLIFLPLVVFASLLPDVDHENSKINRLLPITRVIPMFFSHRGFFHSIFPPLALYGVVWYAGLPQIALALTVGYCSHLLSDCCTRLGCNLIHPLSTFRIQGPIFTDGLMEYVLFGGVMVANGALIVVKIIS